MTPSPFTPERKSELIVNLRYLLSLVEKLPEQRACTTCLNFQPEAWCRHWEAEVPASSRASGCDQWLADIPF